MKNKWQCFLIISIINSVLDIENSEYSAFNDCYHPSSCHLPKGVSTEIITQKL
jgi:hypothetical protein